MEQIFVSCLSLLSAGCVIGVVGSTIGIIAEGNSKRKRVENFNSIELNMSYKDVCVIMGAEGLLVSEKNLGSIKGNQTTYIWYLGWHISSRVSSRVNHTVYHNNSLKHSGGNGKVLTNNRERTYILVILENDKVVSKEQKGLGL